ncbi:hypothetical protein [Mycolicibacterium gilvum]|uniref:Uncharacterized protein n=1 Tax=Mycolicibacterium gilvum TaxID=1804 RepID=A0A378SK27_9MYCO|nr:hypothetical protein [Mycolicibacterium gilvum]STZ43189.1 Uncharacterised protein [Mycolicibacterium gilvum]
MSAAHDWWMGLSQQERDHLNDIAQQTPLGLLVYPYWDAKAAAEILAWLQLENDILQAHGDWLSRTKARFERNGWPWTTGELMRRAHLWEHE